MSRRLPRAFFWVDQSLIRNGIWSKLSGEGRLGYIAVAASCDRQGVSIWSRNKLMELAACSSPEAWSECLAELQGHRLIELLPEHSPPAIRLTELEPENPAAGDAPKRTSHPASGAQAPIVVHTHTTIHLGGQASHAEARSSD